MLLQSKAHRFSVDDYHQMIHYGILDENDPVELIRGEIVQKMPIGDKHVGSIIGLNVVFTRIVGDAAFVSIQNPVVLRDSEPEPDLTLLRPRDDFYKSGMPKPKDVLLLIEVADSSLEFDRDAKLAVYAENGITEYWIINLIDDCLEVYRQPQADGIYGETQTLHRGQEIDIAAVPGITIAVDQLL